jgi:hypothetical protein
MDVILRLLLSEILWPVNGQIYSLPTCKSLPESMGSSVSIVTTLRDILRRNFSSSKGPERLCDPSSGYPEVNRPSSRMIGALLSIPLHTFMS